MEPFLLRVPSDAPGAQNSRGGRLSVAGNHIVGGHREGSFGRTVFELVEVSLGCGDVGSCPIHRIGNRAEFLHQVNDPSEVFLCQGSGFHAVDDHLPVLLLNNGAADVTAAASPCLGGGLARAFAQVFAVGGVVERVVGHLEGDPKILAEPEERILLGF